MRRFWILLSLFSALLTSTGAWAASVSQNHRIKITDPTKTVSFSPTSLTFASQNTDTSSAAQTVTMTNTGTVSFPLSSVAITGADSGDFSETNNCPSSLAVSAGCQIAVTFRPMATGTRTASLVASATGGGTYTVPLSGAGVSTSTGSAFYVATNGSDSNPGTLAAPFATLTKAQSAMQVSSTIKTTYIRAGTYAPAAISAADSNCMNGNGTDSVTLNAGDNGETWSYYPPDGYDSAIINGQSTTGNSGGIGGNGTGCAFGGYAVSNITIIGLQFENYLYSALWVNQGSALTFSDNVVYNLTAAAWGAGAVSMTCVPGAVVENNYMYDLAYTGTEIETTSTCSGGISNVVVSANVIMNSCTWPEVSGFGNDQNGGDCGAIYFQDIASPSSTNIHVLNNYVRDINVSSNGAGDNGSGGSGGCCADGIYLDDGVSNATVSGNVLAGKMSGCFQIHGGNTDLISGNICDLDNSAYQNIVIYQWDNLDYSMSGNVFENNVITADSSGAGSGFVGYSSPPTPMTIKNNAYFNYVGSSVNHSGTGGVGPGDTNPTYQNPDISCWAADIASRSPVFNSPVSFRGITGGWGPPGFVIPQTGTAPSWPHAC